MLYCSLVPRSKEKNKRCNWRHKYNNRKQQATLKLYAKGILEDGYESTARNSPIAVYYKGSGQREFVAGATLMEAFYLAKEEDPNNKYVLAMERGGYENVVDLDERTPRDVLMYLKLRGNNKNLLAAQTDFCEIFDAIDEIKKSKSPNDPDDEANEDSHDDDDDIDDDEDADDEDEPKGGKKRNFKQMEQDEWENIEANFPGLFPSYKFYKTARRFVNNMRRENQLDPFKEYMAKYCEYANPQLSMPKTIRVFAQLFDEIFRVADVKSYGDLCLRIAKFAVPTVGSLLSIYTYAHP